MRKQIKGIYATCSEIREEFFDLDSATDYCSQDDCIKWEKIQFFGFERELTDIDYEAISNGDFSMLKKIGDIVGCLILGRQIEADGEIIHDVCDDVDGDLEYITSALGDPGEPLDDDPAQDIFYIHEFSMNDIFPELTFKARILDELPHLCLQFFHIKPDLLAFFPSPMDYDDIDEDDEARKATVIELSRQKLNAAFLEKPKGEGTEPPKVIELGTVRKFSDDELNIIMGRRRSGKSYPESAKNLKEFEFYEANGFTEAGDSRLLYKQVEE